MNFQAQCRIAFQGVLFFLIMSGSEVSGASGFFPKMPAAAQVNVIDCMHDSPEARRTAEALEGLLNRSEACIYLIHRPTDQEQLNASGKPNVKLPLLDGNDAGLRTLFKGFSGRAKKMFLYDPAKDWTFDLALMASAQQDGIPVTESTKALLVSETGWTGKVEDFRSKWETRIQACDWALRELMPGCSRKVVFALDANMPLVDYAAATKGFVFRLDMKNLDEAAEAEKIFATNGYTVGSSLMGYAGDDANEYANKFGIGYVVSDLYTNGSFWSSFPNKTYRQNTGTPRQALPGKIYVCLTWSDGDNIQFDQGGIFFQLWHDPNRKLVPVATTLSPALQELNPPLLDWYYSKMTPNDELIAGPSGMQFIYAEDYKASLFSAWCNRNKAWLADAGFHSACVWRLSYPGSRYATYIETCGLAGGIFDNSNKGKLPPPYDMTFPIVDEGGASWNEEDLFNSLAGVAPDEKHPLFISRKCIVAGFIKGGGAYGKIKSAVSRLDAAYPGRYVFMLPKDFFATIRAYRRALGE